MYEFTPTPVDSKRLRSRVSLILFAGSILAIFFLLPALAFGWSALALYQPAIPEPPEAAYLLLWSASFGVSYGVLWLNAAWAALSRRSPAIRFLVTCVLLLLLSSLTEFVSSLLFGMLAREDIVPIVVRSVLTAAWGLTAPVWLTVIGFTTYVARRRQLTIASFLTAAVVLAVGIAVSRLLLQWKTDLPVWPSFPLNIVVSIVTITTMTALLYAKSFLADVLAIFATGSIYLATFVFRFPNQFNWIVILWHLGYALALYGTIRWGIACGIVDWGRTKRL